MHYKVMKQEMVLQHSSMGKSLFWYISYNFAQCQSRDFPIELCCNTLSCFTTFYAPINVLPHHPPLRRKWGFTGGIDTKLLPHYGAFDDRSVSTQIFFVVTSFAMSNPE